MKKKSEALSVFRQWKHDVETFFKTEIGELHLSPNWLDFFQTDNSTEYLNALFKAELSRSGTIHHTTAADTPEQDGLAERMNQTLATKATAMLIELGLPKSFWSDAMSTSSFLTARSPASGLRGKTPYTKIFKRKVDASWFRPFGCLAYALIPKPNRPWKLAPKGRKSILLGYTTGKKAYRLLDLTTRKVFHSRHIRFDETGTKPSIVDLQTKDAPPDQWEDILRTKSRASWPATPSSDDDDLDRTRSQPPTEGLHHQPDVVSD
jgi:hypothetical protein